jgi:hypothetical protein
MRIHLTGFELNPAGAQTLKRMLAGDRSSPCADALISHATGIGAKFAVLEEPYTDQDYSSDFLQFYASAFKDHPRHTRRVHLFSEDVSGWFEKPLLDQVKDEAIDAAYLGFVVVRPVSQGPIGRTVLRFPKLDGELCVRVSARSTSHAHILGKRLEIVGAPFIQQDRRVGACAQASIWMASRPVHIRHRRTAWHSIAEITRLATTPTDADLSQELPAGSAGLNPMHVIRALKAMGHQPLHHYFRDGDGKPTKIPAREVALRYLDSGLPVILGMTNTANDIAHAVAAVGYVEATGIAPKSATTYDGFVRAFVVHDDQRGPYRLMPLTQDDVDHLPRDKLLMQAGQVLTVDDMVSHLFVPLPPRVFLRAERADIVARDFLRQQTAFSEKLINEANDTATKTAIEAFYVKVRSGKLIQRTYLTSAGRYRYHLAKTDLIEPIKIELVTRQLPHFIWVTELLEADSKQISDKGPRRILGHMVVNATSSTDPSNDLLVAHFPHLLIHRNINPLRAKSTGIEAEEVAEFEESAEIYPDDGPYNGRIRMDL